MNPSEHDKLLRERQKWIKELKKFDYKVLLRGSIRIQANRCGKKDCGCKRKRNPIYHGPYSYLSYRGKKSNHSLFLTSERLSYVKRAIENYKRLLQIILEISEINFKLLRYYYRKKG
jgi:hypothetical protein